MRAATCPQHPGIRLNPHCYKCGPEEEPMADDTTVRARVNGGEWSEPVPLQPTLSDALFPPVRQGDVDEMRLTFTGTIRLTQAEYQGYVRGRLVGPGVVVNLRAGGHVSSINNKPGAVSVVTVTVTDLGEIETTGEVWDGE